jgi:hypothetical protein
MRGTELLGVLDLDSPSTRASRADARGLETLAKIFCLDRWLHGKRRQGRPSIREQALALVSRLPREMYSPVRVSMRSTSPSLMNSGTRTTAPVSIFAGLLPPVAVSPRTPGSVSTTLSSMCGGGVTTSGTPFHSVMMQTCRP